MTSYLTFGKRPREEGSPDDPSEMQASLKTSVEMARTLGKVGKDIWGTIDSQLDNSARMISEFRNKTEKLETQLIERSVESSQSTLTSLSLTKGLKKSFTFSKLLSDHLQSCSADATCSVTTHIDDAVNHTLKSVQSQVEAERKSKDALLGKVSSLVSSTSNSMLQSNKHLLDTRVALVQSKLAYGRLKAKYEAEKERVLSASQEIQLLMRLTRFLAEKSKTMEATNKELSRAKAHIRRLEHQLELPEVIKAIAAPFTSSNADAKVLSESGNNMLGAPEYAAFRELQRHDLTLSELVHSWCMQHQQLKNAEHHETELNETFFGLQRQVLMVHHQYLEEKQRREMHERRLCELARQRLTSDVDAAVLNEMNDLRRKYSEALDDKAELKVSFCVASNALEESKKQVKSLEEKIRQMTIDAEGDHVSQTLIELRRMYHAKIEELEKRLEETETQKMVLILHSEASAALMEKCRDSFEKSQDNLIKLSALLQNQQTGKREQCENMVNAVSIQTKKNVEELRKMLIELRNLHHRIDTRNQANLTTHLSVVGEMHDAAETIKQSSLELVLRSSTTRNYSSFRETATELSDTRRVIGLIEIMEKIVQEALQYVVVKLEKTEMDQNTLLNKSLDDAQRIRSLTSALQTLAAERETLRDRLAQSTNLIQKNHITIIERAEMQDATVEDSLEAAEAAEQLSSLKIELDTVRRSFDAAQSELKAVHAAREKLEDQLHREILEKQLMSAEISELKAALVESTSNESNSARRRAELEGRLQETISVIQSSVDRENAAKLSDWSSVEINSVLDSFKHHLERVLETVQEALNQSVHVQEEERTKESDLLYKGYSHVVTILRETCENLGLLKSAGEAFKNKVNFALVEAATEGHMNSSQVNRLILEQKLQEKEKSLEESARELSELKGRFNSTQEQLTKSETMVQRLIQICKTLSADKKKNESQSNTPDPSIKTDSMLDMEVMKNGCVKNDRNEDNCAHPSGDEEADNSNDSVGVQ